MEWQNGDMKFGRSFLEEVMKNAQRFPGRYRMQRGVIKTDGERKYYLIRIFDGEEKAEILFVENEDGEIEAVKINRDDWNVEEALYLAMSGEAEKVEILTN